MRAIRPTAANRESLFRHASSLQAITTAQAQPPLAAATAPGAGVKQECLTDGAKGLLFALPSQMRSEARVALATALFGVVHSALASRGAKSIARQSPAGRRFYRLFYSAQGVVTFGLLAWYIVRQPERTLYRVDGAAAAMMRIGQLAGIAFAVAAARATGVSTLVGLRAALEEELDATRVPAAQGPEAGEEGRLRVEGPFVIVRHPLNLAPLAPFWLTPHMTTRRLAFNCVATLYLVLGSLHEEARLRAVYGEAYERYRRSGIPFFVPRLVRKRSEGRAG